MCSCSDEVLNESKQQATHGTPNETFSFDSITAPNVWSQYQSLEEMLEACQIPEDKLKSMSTDELIEVCMSHPLHFIYSAYNNELRGADVIIRNFNGFSELARRTDAAGKLLNFYDEIFSESVQQDPSFIGRSDISHIGFIELYIASKALPSLYEDDNLIKLEKISDKILSQKIETKRADLFSVRHSFLINAQIKVAKSCISKDDATILKNFLKVGGNLNNPEDYTKISKILNK
jgi:hypothetical protein